jgi:membrane fusion protein, multidrug efflux system
MAIEERRGGGTAAGTGRRRDGRPARRTDLSGTVIAYNTDVVRAQIQGQIISINFTEGQQVHAGDLLAQIDPRPYQAQIEQFTANRDRDQAQLANGQANLNRYTPLEQKGFATTQLLDTQKAQVSPSRRTKRSSTPQTCS